MQKFHQAFEKQKNGIKKVPHTNRVFIYVIIQKNNKSKNIIKNYKQNKKK